MCVCVCVCVREKERETERERHRVTSQHISYLNRSVCERKREMVTSQNISLIVASVCVCVCVCVCVRERERERDGHITAKCTARQKSSLPRLVCKHIRASSLCMSYDSVLLLGLAEAHDYGKGRYISDAACGVQPITMLWVSWPIRADCACWKEGLCRKLSIWEKRGIEDLQ